MDAIGGYFELELSKGVHFHKGAIRLNTARNCFEYVLRVRNCSRVFIPYYTCEVMMEPLSALGIEYEFYNVNELLEPVSLPELGMSDAFLYTNYYGLKHNCVKRLAEAYGAQLIVDNAQSFYSIPIERIDTFYSARKFFGVSDGSYLYAEKKLDQELQQDVSIGRMSHLLKRIDLGSEAGYQDFCMDDDSLRNQMIMRMSKLTEAILCGIDYETVKCKRRENYSFLNEVLRDSNLIHLDMDEEDVPMVYPYLTKDPSLRQRLIDNKVFVATYWPNVKEWTAEGMLERELVDKLIPIPCDHRYSRSDIQRIIQIVLK